MSIIDWLSQAMFSACGLEPLPPDPSVQLTVLDWMEQSALGSCVAQTSAGYYIMLGFHSVGLAMVVGGMMVVALRIIGFAKGISPAALPKFVTIGWWGFWANFISGVAILFSEANKMYYDTFFRIKILLVICGMISTSVMNKTILKPACTDAAKLQTASAKTQAWISLFIWLSVIIVGRMLAYLTEFES
ncbi:MAG: hypothetical protein QM808_15260 [Steroidobacteraceae bacterium]